MNVVGKFAAIAIAALMAGPAMAADSPSGLPAPVGGQPTSGADVSQNGTPAAVPTAAARDAASASSLPSIMLWPDDVASIKKAIEDRDHPPPAELAAEALANMKKELATEASKPHKPNIYVSAILDFGEGNWAVWANGLEITPDKQSPLFHIVGVHGDTVDIVVPGEGGDRFSLEPYQTWRSRKKDIVEGIEP